MSVPAHRVTVVPLSLASPLPPALVSRYLTRLGIDDPGPVGAEGLRRLHHAHVERVPYENLDLVLGLPAPIAVEASVARVLAGRGGYCFHLNGAFAALLASLGYDVVPRRAGIHPAASAASPGVTDTHLALTVHEVPGDDGTRGDWLVDVGLGDALHGPLPLVPGRQTQGPFTYGLRRSRAAGARWRFDHDRAGVFRGMEVGEGVATIDDFARRHHEFCTDATSALRRVVSVQRRDALGVDLLIGLRRSRREGGGTRSRVLADRDEWFACLEDDFGLELAALDDRRDDLWTLVRAEHASRYGTPSEAQTSR